SFGAKISSGVPDSNLMFAVPIAKTARICSNSRAIAYTSEGLPLLMTRKCSLRTSIQGLSPAKAWLANATIHNRNNRREFLITAILGCDYPVGRRTCQNIFGSTADGVA